MISSTASYYSTEESIEITVKHKGRKHPLDAWLLISLFFASTAVGARVGLGSILNILFPFGALAIGFYLFVRYPKLYIGFSWWLWFITPFLRRLADYWGSYTEPSPMLLAPFLVAGLTILTALRELPNAHKNGSIPFVIASTGVIFGLCVGGVNSSLYAGGFPLTLIQALLEWLVPITFGWYLFSNWQDYSQYRQLTQRAFSWGVLVMGIYSIWQYLALPDWDRLWLIESGLFSSQGLPDESGGMRVWSTMHSGEPFAAYMAGGLLMLLNSLSSVALIGSIAGLLGLLLTTVRSAWLGFFSGLIMLFGSLKPNFQIRLIAIVTVIALCVIPLSMSENFSDDIVSRFSTLSNLESDTSAQERKQAYAFFLGRALSSVTGRGLGLGIGDSALLSILFQIGWIGVLFYMGGMLLLISNLFSNSANKKDPFAAAMQAIIVSAFIRMPVNSIFAGPAGVLLWAAIGLGCAAVKYQKHQPKYLEN